MKQEKSSQKIDSNFIVLVSRIKPELKPFISIISVGFTLLLDTWDFPVFDREGAINTRVALTEGDRASLFYLTQHSGRSASEVISAALTRAKNSKVRPQNFPGVETWRVTRKPDLGAAK